MKRHYFFTSLILLISLGFFPFCNQSDEASATGVAALTNVAPLTYPRTSQRVLRATFQVQATQIQLLGTTATVEANPSLFSTDVEASPYVVQTVSGDGTVLFSGGIGDPRVVRSETEVGQQGKLQSREISLADNVFQLKIPLPEGAVAVVLLKRTPLGSLQEVARFAI